MKDCINFDLLSQFWYSFAFDQLINKLIIREIVEQTNYSYNLILQRRSFLSILFEDKAKNKIWRNK